MVDKLRITRHTKEDANLSVNAFNSDQELLILLRSSNHAGESQPLSFNEQRMSDPDSANRLE